MAERLRVGLGVLMGALALSSAAGAGELLFGTEGNRLRRFDVDTIGSPKLLSDIFVESAEDGVTPVPGPTSPGGRDMNGMICRFKDGSGRFVNGEDTGQVAIRPGWGVFDANANEVGKLVTTYLDDPNDDRVGEQHGCGFDSQGRLFTTAVGQQSFGAHSGQLILWFPPYDVFPGAPGTYPNGEISTGKFCKIDVSIGSATGMYIDAQDNVYVASPASFQVLKFSPPFPTGPDAAGGCGRLDPTGQPLADADRSNRSVFIQGAGVATFTGLARARNGNLYVGQVLSGQIDEYDFGSDPNRAPVRNIVPAPGGVPAAAWSPQGLAVGANGTLYFADLDIQSNLSPGPDGRFWRVRFDAKGNPQPPEPILTGLAFPDGVSLFPGDLQVDPQREWRTYAGGPKRLFHAPDESILTPKNVGLLRERWHFQTGAVVTSSPAVAVEDLGDGQGPTQVVYFQSWDGKVYAVRLADGSEVWHYTTDNQPGVSFPGASSPHVEEIDGHDVVLIGEGEWFYALDAVTGARIWRFTAGTGCGEGVNPPGLCSFGNERNQVESSGIVADGKVFFGMDVNDGALGKGGLYAVDAATGELAWFFDLESGMTCRPDPGEAITRFDGYHSEEELGLPTGFRARAGCNFPASRNGCENVWSSAAYDEARGAIFIASGNCDTDADPSTNAPPPPMPPFDEAIFSLDTDGNVRWRWRPREVDNDDLEFGAVPNLFTIERSGQDYEVVGVGAKDGTYYVIDRDGVNQESGVAWNDADPSGLPYWTRQVVAGGAFGGILATASVDEVRRRVFFSTAAGASMADVTNPQRPTVHALDLDTGAVVWDNGIAAGTDASFSPTSSVPGLVFAGSLLSSTLRVYDAQGDAGVLRFSRQLYPSNFGLGSGAVVINGNVLVGSGIGFRGPNPADLGDQVSRIPSPLVALCIPGQPGCGIPAWRLSDLDDDGDVDDADQAIFLGALGTSAGAAGFVDRADLDRDGVITLVDYQRWTDGLKLYRISLACGLLGIEPVIVLGLLRLAQRRRHRHAQ